MRKTVLDALIFMHQHKVSPRHGLMPKQIKTILQDAGFNGVTVLRVFDWLKFASPLQADRSACDWLVSAARVYAREECDYLSAACRGFLYFIEEIGILDTALRELIIDRILALGEATLSVTQLKWLVLIVLSYVPGREPAVHQLLEMVERSQPQPLH